MAGLGIEDGSAFKVHVFSSSSEVKYSELPF